MYTETEAINLSSTLGRGRCMSWSRTPCLGCWTGGCAASQRHSRLDDPFSLRLRSWRHQKKPKTAQHPGPVAAGKTDFACWHARPPAAGRFCSLPLAWAPGSLRRPPRTWNAQLGLSKLHSSLNFEPSSIVITRNCPQEKTAKSGQRTA